MKKIVINTARYPKDVMRIQQILADKGYEASPVECEALWDKYSESMCAGWMTLGRDSDEQVFDCISSYIEN